MRSSVDCQPSTLRVDENLSPASLDSVVAERDAKLDKYSSASAIDSPECLKAGQVYSLSENLCYFLKETFDVICLLIHLNGP